MTVTYRAPGPDDIEALAALGRQTFSDTFAHLYSEENLQRFLTDTYSVEAVTSDLENPLQAYVIAEAGGAMVGYCKVHDGVSLDYDAKDRKVMELKQLYVVAGYQGKGVAVELMRRAKDQAMSLDADEILLSVYSENYRAQKFYRKHGFEYIGDTVFMVGDHADHEFLFVKKLK